MTKLDELLVAHGKPVKALLATHYFGLAKDFTELKLWCDTHRIAFIEDCSHTLFTETFQAPGTGIFGRFVAASPYKFFACADGGLLQFARPSATRHSDYQISRRDTRASWPKTNTREIPINWPHRS
ncbi:MAG: DegT/DnrJ/EryC1/StrS aminotransferase family protein [Propionivibrio sp.]|nr:DegT/DnrJ/EryC1/StrS aminotransferase family protein [Propionivibrio sp.]